MIRNLNSNKDNLANKEHSQNIVSHKHSYFNSENFIELRSVRPFLRNGKLFLLILLNCLLNLSGIIPLAVWYLVESKATLKSISESQYVHFKHNDFWFCNSLI